MTEKLGIYRFHWDCGRQGDLKGIFIASNKDVKSILGKDIYFGEILGKHSEVYGTIEEGEITLLTDNEEAVKVARDFGLSSGYNPFDYIGEEEDENDEEE